MSLLIADDNVRERSVLVQVFTQEFPDLLPVFEAENGRKAVDLANSCRPDLIIMDIQMPELNGIDAAAAIFEKDNSAKIIIFSQHQDEAYVRRLWKIAKSCVFGYVLKDASDEELVVHAKRVLQGFCSIDFRIRPVRDHNDLTANQWQVLVGIAIGLTNEEMSKQLFVGRPAIEARLAQLYSTLEVPPSSAAVSTRCMAVNRALKRGLINSSMLVDWGDDYEKALKWVANMFPEEEAPGKKKQKSRK